MKRSLILLCVLASGPISRAGAYGGLAAREVDWAYVQETRGLEMREPAQSGHRWVLPVEYDVHGTRAVTRRPARLTSASPLWRANLVRDEGRLYFAVVVCRNEAVADRALGTIGIPPQASILSLR